MAGAHRRALAGLLGLLLVLVTLPLGALRPATAAPTETVERWRGQLHGRTTVNLDGFTSGGFPLIARAVYTMDYALEADETGYVRGDITTTLHSYSIQMTGSTCAALIQGCLYAAQITDPTATTFIEGHREIWNGEPRLRISGIVDDDPAHYLLSLHGSIFGIPTFVENIEEWTPALPLIFAITPAELGRPPLGAPTPATYADAHTVLAWHGEIVALGREPSVAIDPELLERSVFLAGIPVENVLTADVDWNAADAGWLSWRKNGESPTRTGLTRASRVPQSHTVGDPTPGKARVQVEAHNAIGLTSKPQTHTITTIALPTWLAQLLNVQVSKIDKGVAYKFPQFKFPAKPLKTDGVMPGWMPFFGGQKVGFKETQAQGEAEIKSSGEGSIKAGGQAAFEASSFEFSGALFLKALIKVSDAGIDLSAGELEGRVAGKFKHEKPIVEFHPTGMAALALVSQISPWLAGEVSERATLALEIEAKFTFALRFKDVGGDLVLQSVSGSPALGLKGTANVLITDNLKMSASAGGEVGARLTIEPPYSDGGYVKLFVQVGFTIHRWSLTGEKSWSHTITRGRAAGPPPEPAATQVEPTWTLMPRPYLTDADYSTWTAPAITDTTALTRTLDQRLVSHSDPDARPHLAVREAAFSSDVWMSVVWGQERPGTPAQGGGEIAAATFDGQAWSQRSLTSDALSDRNPRAAVLVDGSTVVVWQRYDLTSPGDFNADPLGYLSHQRVAGLRYVPGQAVPQPSLLSPAGSLSHGHQVAALNDEAVAVWINNPANVIGGDTARPDRIMAAPMSAFGVWGAPVAVATDQVGVGDVTLASNGSFAAAAVWSRDMDGSFSTTSDRELFYATYTFGSWDPPVRLTSNSVADNAPQLVLDRNGQPLLVWRQGQELRYLAGSWTAAQLPLALPDATPTAISLGHDPQGAGVLTWSSSAPTGAAVGYSFYDSQTGQWGAGGRLPAPALPTDAEAAWATTISPAVVGTSSPLLVAAYDLVAVDLVTETVVVSPTASVEMPNLPRPGRHELRLVMHPARRDLSISPADIWARPVGAAPGAPLTMTVVVRNTGDLGARNVPVTAARGTIGEFSQTQLAAVTVPQLAAGQAYTLTVPITRPLDGATRFEASVNRGRQIRENDYTNNTAALGQDFGLALDPVLYAPGGAVLGGRVAQRGAVYAAGSVTATVRLADPQGPLLGVLGWTFPVTPTAEVLATAWISDTQLGPGRHLVWVTLDPGSSRALTHGSAELTAATVVSILPDLRADQHWLGWGRTAGPSTPVSLRVCNRGQAPSLATQAAFFDDDPELGTSPRALGSLPVPALAAGACAELDGTLALDGTPHAATGLTQLWVRLDPAHEIEELSENNNVVYGGPRFGSYPALTPRVLAPLITR